MNFNNDDNLCIINKKIPIWLKVLNRESIPKHSKTYRYLQIKDFPLYKPLSSNR